MNVLRLFVLSLAVVLAGCASQSKHVSKQPDAMVAADTSRTIDLTRPPQDIWDRIRRGYAIPNLRTDLVDQWTEYYARNAPSVITMSERASKYLYHILDEIEARGLPTELALLPFVESAYNPVAYSKAHASGLWQFIPSTGRQYKLEQTWWQDQRRDPIASTTAALDYLDYLYEFQGDWYLALASYNWGEGSVRRAIQRNEQQNLGTDYLSLRMPEETRNYVPKLQAIKNIIANPQRYGISLPKAQNAPYFANVRTQQNIDLHIAARLAEMSIEEFKALNPSHNREVIPAHYAELVLPVDKVKIFEQNLAVFTEPLSQWQTYEPQHGESFSTIAQQHGMTIAELRKLNGLSAKQTLASTQSLLVPITTPSTPTVDDPLGVQLATLSNQGVLAGSPSKPSVRPVSASSVAPKARGNVALHQVRKGDTLFGIARQYNISLDELKKLNNLKNNHIKPGHQLRVPGTQVRG